MFNVKIPVEVQQSLTQAVVRVAMQGGIAGWDALSDRLRGLDPDAAWQQELGLIVAAAREEMPQLLGALRVGVVVCQAVRNEIEFAKASAGDN